MSDSKITSNTLGPVLFARYAFAPNKLKFCGPDKNRTIFEYAVDSYSDQDLVKLLSEFEGAYPYLQFIAFQNKILDPFDWRVVEAYWLGNDLLNQTEISKFYHHLKDRFAGRLKPAIFRNLATKVPQGAKPYHAFHVFDIYTRIGGIRGIDLGPVLETINNCRISWAKVIGRDVLRPNKILTEYQKIIEKNNQLVLGPKNIESFEYKLQGKSFVGIIEPGDWVSVHWGWVCDKLDSRQLQNLKKWTLWHLKIANSTRSFLSLS